MQINLSYNTKSIAKAIKQIEEYRKRLKNLMPEFLTECAKKVQELANEKVKLVGLGVNVENEIISSWTINKESDKLISLTNKSEKSVYVEFGVGEVGATQPHPMSGEQGYQYNLSSPHKWSNPYSGESQWYISFHSNEDIDLPETYYEPLTEHKYINRTRKYIRTSGQPAAMFAFNAVQDFIEQKMYVSIWEKLIKGLS